MPIQEDSKSTLQRLSVYVQKLTNLFKKFDITGPRRLWKAVRDSEFRTACQKIFSEVAKAEGGKLTLTTISILIGAALGGVGIAAMGGAIGMPLALLLAPVGYFAGSRLDSSNKKKRAIEQTTSSAEPAAQDEYPETDLEEMAELLATLLSRNEAAEAKTLELEGKISELLARCEKGESATRELEARVVAMEARIDCLEATISESQSSLARLNQRIKHLIWSGFGLILIAVAVFVWCFIRK